MTELEHKPNFGFRPSWLLIVLSVASIVGAILWFYPKYQENTQLMEETRKYVGIVVATDGQVQIRSANDVWEVIANDTKIAVGDGIRTADGAYAEVQFQDGSVISVAPTSEMSIETYEQGDAYRFGKVNVVDGKVGYDIESADFEESVFQITSEISILTVSGTKGAFGYDRATHTATSELIEGEQGDVIYGQLTAKANEAPKLVVVEPVPNVPLEGQLLATLTAEEHRSLSEVLEVVSLGGADAVAILNEAGDLEAALELGVVKSLTMAQFVAEERETAGTPESESTTPASSPVVPAAEDNTTFNAKAAATFFADNSILSDGLSAVLESLPEEALPEAIANPEAVQKAVGQLPWNQPTVEPKVIAPQPPITATASEPINEEPSSPEPSSEVPSISAGTGTDVWQKIGLRQSESEIAAEAPSEYQVQAISYEAISNQQTQAKQAGDSQAMQTVFASTDLVVTDPVRAILDLTAAEREAEFERQIEEMKAEAARQAAAAEEEQAREESQGPTYGFLEKGNVTQVLPELEVLSAARFLDKVVLGDDGSDQISLLGQLTSDLVPASGSEHNLGVLGQAWSTLYVDNAVAGQVASQALSVNGESSLLGDVVLGQGSLDSLQVNSRLSGDLIPVAASDLALGALDSAWSDLYVQTILAKEMTLDKLTVFGPTQLQGDLPLMGSIVNPGSTNGGAVRIGDNLRMLGSIGSDAAGPLTINDNEGLLVRQEGGRTLLTVDQFGDLVVGVFKVSNKTADGAGQGTVADQFEIQVDGDIEVSGVSKSQAGVFQPTGNANVALQVNNTLAAPVFSVDENGLMAVSGRLNLGNNLAVAGNLAVLGSTSVQDFFVSSAATLNSSLGVRGAVTLNNSLGVTGAASFSSAFTVAGNVTLGDQNGDVVSILGVVDSADADPLTVRDAQGFEVENSSSGTTVFSIGNSGNVILTGTTFDASSATLTASTVTATTLQGTNGVFSQVDTSSSGLTNTFAGPVQAGSGLSVTGGNFSVGSTFTINQAGVVTGDIVGNAATVTNGLYTTDIGSAVQGYRADTAFRNDKLSVFAATNSSELAGLISDESGSGALVFGISPALTSPVITGGELTALSSTQFGTGNLYLSGTTIGLSSDTNLLSLAANALTVNGTLTLGTLGAGSTDTVVSQAGGTLQTRTIDSRVWGSTLLDDSDISVTTQAYDSDLATLAGLTGSNKAFIVGTGSGWTTESGGTVRTSLGLGTGDTPTFTNLTLSSDLVVLGSTSVQDLFVASAATLNSSLGVSGAVTLNNSLGVTGATSFSGAFTATGNVTLGDQNGDVVSILGVIDSADADPLTVRDAQGFEVENSASGTTVFSIENNGNVTLTGTTFDASSATLTASTVTATTLQGTNGVFSQVDTSSSGLTNSFAGPVQAASGLSVTGGILTVGGSFSVSQAGVVTGNLAGNAATVTNGLYTTDIGSVVQGYNADTALRNDKLSVFAATNSSEFAGLISDESGSGALVFGISPAITSPVITGGDLTALSSAQFGSGNLYLTGTTVGLSTDTNLLALAANALTVSGTLTVGTLDAGSTDSVVSQAGGTLQTREIDSRVWGSTLLDDSDISATTQAYDSDLVTLAGFTPSDGSFIVGSGSGWTTESGGTVRTSLGLGTGDTPTFTNLTLSSDLVVLGSTSVQDLFVASAATLNSSLGVSGAVTLNNSLGVTGATSFSGAFTATGNVTLGDQNGDVVSILGSLDSGDADPLTVRDAQGFEVENSASGTTVFSIENNGNVTLTGTTFDASSATLTASTVTATTLQGTNGVFSQVDTSSSGLTNSFAGPVQAASGLSVTGGNLTVGGSFSISQAGVVTGDPIFSGNPDFGVFSVNNATADGASVGVVVNQFEAQVSGDLGVSGVTKSAGILVQPAGDGQTALRVNNTSALPVFTVDENGLMAVSGTLSLGSNLDVAGALHVSGSTTLQDLDVASAATLNNSLGVTGNVSFSDALTVAGDVSLGNQDTDVVSIPGLLDSDDSDPLTVRDPEGFEVENSASGTTVFSIGNNGNVILTGTTFDASSATLTANTVNATTIQGTNGVFSQVDTSSSGLTNTFAGPVQAIKGLAVSGENLTVGANFSVTQGGVISASSFTDGTILLVGGILSGASDVQTTDVTATGTVSGDILQATTTLDLTAPGLTVTGSPTFSGSPNFTGTPSIDGDPIMKTTEFPALFDANLATHLVSGRELTTTGSGTLNGYVYVDFTVDVGAGNTMVTLITNPIGSYDLKATIISDPVGLRTALVRVYYPSVQGAGSVIGLTWFAVIL